MTPTERDLSYVRRWAIVRTIRVQSVAEHCFWVARIVEWLAPKMDVELSPSLYMWALHHDDEEVHSGDVPAPYKTNVMVARKHASGHNLNGDELLCVKLADLIEAYLFLVEEQRLGNQTVSDTKAYVGRHLDELIKNSPILKREINNMITHHSLWTGRME